MPNSPIGWITIRSLTPRLVCLFTFSLWFRYSTSTTRITPSLPVTTVFTIPYWKSRSNSLSDFRKSTTSPTDTLRSFSNHLGRSMSEVHSLNQVPVPVFIQVDQPGCPNLEKGKKPQIIQRPWNTEKAPMLSSAKTVSKSAHPLGESIDGFGRSLRNYDNV